MLDRKTNSRILACALTVCAAASAQATVMHTDVNQSLGDTPYTLTLDNNASVALRSATDGVGGYDLALATGGDARVAGSSVFGSYEYIDKFAAGDEISNNSADFISTSPAGTYSDVPSENNIQTPYIGLRYLVDGLQHFAYAGFAQSVDGFSLTDYGYETVAGRAISAGATGPANEVPAPGGLLGAIALATLALIGLRRRQPGV